MARLARLVIPGLPHHVTQHGNRRRRTFFKGGDYAACIELVAGWCREESVEIWTHGLMPTQVRLIAVPQTEIASRRAIGEAHRRDTRRIHFREKWRGYLWPGRLASVIMDEPHLLAAAPYGEVNPARAGLVADAAEWPWSSVWAPLEGRDDRLVRVCDACRLEGIWGPCHARRRVASGACPRAYRPAARQRLGSRLPGDDGRSHSTSPESRPAATATQNIITRALPPDSARIRRRQARPSNSRATASQSSTAADARRAGTM